MCPYCVAHECSIRHTLKSIADDKSCVVQSIPSKGKNIFEDGDIGDEYHHLLRCTFFYTRKKRTLEKKIKVIVIILKFRKLMKT